MRNQAWANYIKAARKLAGLDRKGLAEAAKIDPSYITLVERDGYVPRKGKVLDLLRALGLETNEGLLIAGYAPEGVPVRDLLSALLAMRGNELPERARIFQEIDQERGAQDKKWGADRKHTPAHWLAVLTEEVGEVANAYLEHDEAGFRAELVQVAAVACCILESLK